MLKWNATCTKSYREPLYGQQIANKTASSQCHTFRCCEVAISFVHFVQQKKKKKTNKKLLVLFNNSVRRQRCQLLFDAISLWIFGNCWLCRPFKTYTFILFVWVSLMFFLHIHKEYQHWQLKGTLRYCFQLFFSSIFLC